LLLFILGEKEADRYLSSSDDDEKHGNSRLIIDMDEEEEPLPPTKASKKRVSEPKKKTPIAKRLRFTTNDDDKNEDQQLDLQQLLNYTKQVNANVLKLQKQQEQTTVTLARQDQFLKTLCKNQKKLAKSLTRRKVRPMISNILFQLYSYCFCFRFQLFFRMMTKMQMSLIHIQSILYR
jgi:hypothetical protein